MKEYYEIGSQNYHFIDDSPSIYINFSCFVEHRHDQSIFSLLTKKYNLFSEYSLNDEGYIPMDAIDIHRNKSGISQINDSN